MIDPSFECIHYILYHALWQSPRGNLEEKGEKRL